MHRPRGTRTLAAAVSTLALAMAAVMLAGCFPSDSPTDPIGGDIDLVVINNSAEIVRVVYTTTPGVTDFDDFEVDEDGNSIGLERQNARAVQVGNQGAAEQARIRLRSPEVLSILAIQFYDADTFQSAFDSTPVSVAGPVFLEKGVDYTGGQRLEIVTDNDFDVDVTLLDD